MTIKLNEQLKKLRKTKGNTQEDIANFLGISIQAVSKWERGEGYPDITLLPSIAGYYSVSIDTLLGVDEIEKQKKLDEYISKGQKLFNEGKSSERVALYREAAREFPGDHVVLYHLMYALQAESRKRNADEIIEYGEKILDESTDNALRNGAIQSLCFTYYHAKKDVARAKKYALMAGNYCVTQEELMAHILEGDEAVELSQHNLMQLTDLIYLNVYIMIRKGSFSAQDKIKALSFAYNIFKALFEDGNMGFYHGRIREIGTALAREYMLLGEKAKATDFLCEAARNAMMYDTRESGRYTYFLVDMCEDDITSSAKDYTANESACMLDEIENKIYDRLRNDICIQNIVSELKKPQNIETKYTFGIDIISEL